MKPGGQLNCTLNEIYVIIYAGKTLPLAFFSLMIVTNGENNLSPLILDVALEYALRKDKLSCVVQRHLCAVRTLFIC